MSVSLRKSFFIALVVVFFVQTWMVYTDSAGRMMPALSDMGAKGRELWHENNCQSCHQLYGFGGFLGPDLTNAAGHLAQSRIDSILTVGAAQMPAYQLDEGERGALMAFLAEVGSTGIGQLGPAPESKSGDVLGEAITAALQGGAPELSAAELRGMDIVIEQACLSCHLPNPLAAKAGTCLTTLTPKLGGAGVEAIVTAGILAKGMPRFALESTHCADLVAFLTWLSDNAEPVRQAFAGVTPPKATGSLPWFEYTR